MTYTTPPTSPQGPIGLFGKIPAQGDFLRLQMADPAAQAFASFLEEAVDAMRRNGAAALPAGPLYFFHRAPGNRSGLIGAFAPSRDRVGRVFPLAVFAPFEVRALASRFPAVPMACAAFLEAAVMLIQESAALDPGALAQRLARLPLPEPAAALESSFSRLQRAAAIERVSAFARRLFGEPAAGAHYYAMNAFRAACKPVRGREPDRGGVALECPASGDLERFAWLELARRSLHWDLPPAFFWSDSAQPRLLLSLGPVSPALIAHFAGPSHANSKIWPLRIEQPAAVAAAVQALGPAVKAAIDRDDATLEELIATVSAL